MSGADPALVVQLPTGRLSVQARPGSPPLQQLCGFAARNNPKRGFLFVSKLLGKHWPCSPAAMQQAQRQLAAQIEPELLPGALVIGMAETATGLGHGLYEALLDRAATLAVTAPALYLQSTRYPLAGAERLEFEEPHSHAAQQLLYWPERPELRRALQAARCVVLVDDEISTGQTLTNLVAVLRTVNPDLRHVVLACLTDFSDGAAERRMAAVPGITSVATAALFRGAFEFERDPHYAATPAAPAFAAMDCRRDCLSGYSARLGLSGALQLPEALLQRCAGLAGPAPQRPLLVLGTGEFMHPAYLLAQALAARGIDCRVQSTTRSPILVGADIHSRLELPDPYREGIPNYLYNLRRADYAAVLVVHETPRNAELAALCTALQAHAVSLQDHLVVAPAAPAIEAAA